MSMRDRIEIGMTQECIGGAGNAIPSRYLFRRVLRDSVSLVMLAGQRRTMRVRSAVFTSKLVVGGLASDPAGPAASAGRLGAESGSIRVIADFCGNSTDAQR